MSALPCSCLGNWLHHPPQWTESSLNVLNENLDNPKHVEHVKLEEIIHNTSKFSIPFPIESIKTENLNATVPQETLERNANSVYPVVHETVLYLYYQFLMHKKKFGTELEKKVYQNMSLLDLVDRLLRKRAVMFVGWHDKAILLDGSFKSNCWETIGMDKEVSPLTLENYISYDEIKLSAYLSVSSYTYFTNVGDRGNCGFLEPVRNKVEDEGIIIGLIGTRFEKAGLMDYQECLVTKEQNVHENGYGQFFVPTLRGIFVNFLGEPCLTFEEQANRLKDEKMFTEKRPGMFFNHAAYMKRIALTIDTLLIEANQRARDAGKMAYVHVVGLGLGVWKICDIQNKLYMDTFCERITFLGKALSNVSDICFAHIREPCGKYNNGDKIPITGHPEHGINVHIFDRQPHEKLKGKNAGKLLVVSYAWDGNALPGNEFWSGSLAGSGDPACACSTQVAELHNAHINPKLNGFELRVATLQGTVVPYGEYCANVARKLEEEKGK